MNRKINTSNLGPIQQTLMIPLMGRAVESKKKNGILNDQWASEIIDSIDFDFDIMDSPISRLSMSRTVVRTKLIDMFLLNYLEYSPQATVIELGCGLNTRFQRTDNGKLVWFDLDVPDVYELWAHFFQEDKRHFFLPYSAFDFSWIDKVLQKSNGPFFVISEASVIYFPESEVESLFKHMSSGLRDCTYIFDSSDQAFANYIEGNDVLKFFSQRPKFKWISHNISTINDWVTGLKILQRIDMNDMGSEYEFLFGKNKNELLEDKKQVPPVDGKYHLNLVKLN